MVICSILVHILVVLIQLDKLHHKISAYNELNCVDDYALFLALFMRSTSIARVFAVDGKVTGCLNTH